MNKTLVKLLMLVGLFTFSTPSINAQISFSVNQQNGVVTGGGFQVGGFVMPGATGVRLGISAATNQLIGLQNFTFQNGSNNAPAQQSVNSQPTPKFSAGRFVKATKRFDKNEDGRLDTDELNKIATAVVAEFRQMNGDRDRTPSIQAGPKKPGTSTPTAEQMQAAFVKQSMTFDKDEDGTLDSTETKLMAAALTRSLKANRAYNASIQ